jgi:hypothetical protein
MTKTQIPPDAVTGEPKLADEITDKCGYGKRWQHSVRSVDNWIAQGLPHVRIGERRTRIVIAEADAWMIRRFGRRRVQFRKAEATGEKEAA